jgi:hypothetical protein
LLVAFSLIGSCAEPPREEISTRDSVDRVTKVIGVCAVVGGRYPQPVETAAKTVRDLRVAEVLRDDV